METILSVIEVIAPIFLAIFLGILAKRKELMTDKEVRGLQQFAIQFGLPCVVFSSCLTANMGLESLSSMVLMLIPCLIGTFWAFGPGKKKFPYHNLPMMFSARETGMLGIPLFMILFGAYIVVCLIAQAALCLLPGVDMLTRWAVLLYCVLPCSYLSPGMGSTQKEQAIGSGVCSVLTVVCLAVFCVLTAFVA